MEHSTATLLGGTAFSAPVTSRTAPPEAVESLTILPQLDGAILRARRIKLAIRGKGDGPDRAVMTLVDIWSTVSIDPGRKGRYI